MRTRCQSTSSDRAGIWQNGLCLFAASALIRAFALPSFPFQIMFNLERAHFILDEMMMNGKIVETNKKVTRDERQQRAARAHACCRMAHSSLLVLLFHATAHSPTAAIDGRTQGGGVTGID